MSPPPVLLAHASSLEHDTGEHPEHSSRLVAIDAELAARGWLGWERRESEPAPRDDLTAVHSAGYVQFIEESALRGGGFLDLDTVVGERSFEAALYAAGGAVQLVDLLLGGQARTAFSVHRPPGHHATETRAMGFCLFNNVAVAARHAVRVRGLTRVLILDWDVHHGNGTNDIFHSSPEVLFVSIHESPLYPGTGPARDVGSGPGEGYTVNLPVPAGSGDETFCALVDHVAVPLLEAYRPQLVLISAGFDAHRADPLAGCRVTEAGFAAMARSVRVAADSVGAPVGAVLEGGYAPSALARSVAATMEMLGSEDPAGDGWQPAPVTELADQARVRVARRWPAIA